MSDPDSMKAAFHDALSASLRDAKALAWCAATALQGRVQEQGAVGAAKAQIRVHRLLRTERPHRYFKALAERGRLEFSVEYLITSRDWVDLFTVEERETALERLAEGGFVPPDPDGKAMVPAPQTHSLADLRRKVGPLFRQLFETQCDEIAWLHRELAETGHLVPVGRERTHLRDCSPCGTRYPDVTQAFAALDYEWLSVFPALFRTLACSLDLSTERVDKLAKATWVFAEGDVQDADDFDEGFNVHRDFIEECLAWRALLLAEFTGQAMDLYARTLSDASHIWSEWRLHKEGGLSALLQRCPDDSITAALMAKWVFGSCRLRPDEVLIALPADGDLAPIPGLLIVDETDDRDDWEEMLGDPPKSLIPSNLLSMAYTAARMEMSGGQEKFEADLTEVSRSLRDLGDRLESNSALQLPIIDLLERVLRCVDRASRQKGEDSVVTHLGPTYAKLHPQAQESVVAAEQIFLANDFGSRDLVVFCLARAFELQVKKVLLRKLVSHLRDANIRDYPDTSMKLRLLENGREPKNLTLGGIQKNLSVDHPELFRFCQAHGISVERLRASFASVLELRNCATHEPDFSSWRIREIHDEWLGVSTGDGGILASIVE
jgi:hypothetical protein